MIIVIQPNKVVKKCMILIIINNFPLCMIESVKIVNICMSIIILSNIIATFAADNLCLTIIIRNHYGCQKHYQAARLDYGGCSRADGRHKGNTIADAIT